MNISDNMSRIYYKVLFDLANRGKRRAKGEPLELSNYSFKLTNLENNIVNAMEVDYGYLCAEELWFVLGIEDINFINSFHAPGFKRSSEDGIYSNSAYGHILQHRYGFNQIEQVIDILSHKVHSRRAVINLNVPNRHRRTCLDEICTFNLSFYVENDNKLNCTCCMRSNDMIGCMPYDVAYFTNIQKYIAKRLNLPCGYYYHFAISAHCYKDLDRDWLAKKVKQDFHFVVHFDFEKLIEKKDELYKFYLDYLNDPKEEVQERFNNQILHNKFSNERIIY